MPVNCSVANFVNYLGVKPLSLHAIVVGEYGIVRSITASIDKYVQPCNDPSKVLTVTDFSKNHALVVDIYHFLVFVSTLVRPCPTSTTSM